MFKLDVCVTYEIYSLALAQELEFLIIDMCECTPITIHNHIDFFASHSVYVMESEIDEIKEALRSFKRQNAGFVKEILVAVTVADCEMIC